MDERRLLTVMFCDIVGSTALAAALDAEALRDIVRRYQDLGAAAVERFGGHAKYLGDGLLVYFGWPAAHEDDPARAIRAGMQILRGLAALNARLWSEYRVHLSARIGIDSGSVVVGEVGDGSNRDTVAFGTTPNVAARIQSVADPDTLYVGASTAELTSELFELEDRGLFEMRGLREPVRLWRVTGERERRRFAPDVSRLTPMVGRQSERQQLRHLWHQVCLGRSVSVLLTGEPGIGKSRLVHLVEELARDTAHTTVFGQCHSLATNTPFEPVAAALRATLLKAADPIRHIDDVLGAGSATGAPLLADLTDLPCPPARRSALRGWTPQRVRQAMMLTVSTYFQRLSDRGPVLFVVEDLHWADPSTLELLQVLANNAGRGGTMCLFSARPEFTVDWPHLTRLEVTRLGRADAESLAQNTIGGQALSADVVSQVVQRTDGIPLFVEELTKALVHLNLVTSDQDGRLRLAEAMEVPRTLYGSLMARIDVLGDARLLLQVAALLGREVDLPLLAAASGCAGEEMTARISRLINADLLSQLDEQTVRFRHSLIRDAAAATLVSGARRKIEDRIGAALIEVFPTRAAAEPARVAHHLTQAGQYRQAIEWWQRAALAAIQRSANVEAIAHLQSALNALHELPDTADKLAIELDLQSLLGVPLTLTRGWAHPDVRGTFERATDLCGKVEQRSHLSSRIGLTTYYIVRGQYRRAREMALDSLQIAEAIADGDFVVEAAHDCGTTSLYLGEYDVALQYLARVEALYDTSAHASHAWRYGKDPLAVALVHRAMALACTGSADAARSDAARAVAHAQTVGHPFTYLWALVGVAITHLVLDEPAEAASVGTLIVKHADAQGFPNWLAQGLMYVGFGEAAIGEYEGGVAKIRKGLHVWESTGAELGLPVFFCLLGRALYLAGQNDEAWTYAERALTTIRRTGESWTAPEAIRLRGDVEMVRNGAAAAVPFYEAALDAARAMRAGTFEVAAAVALADALRKGGAASASLAVLKPVLAELREGQTGAHRTRARALLRDLPSV